MKYERPSIEIVEAEDDIVTLSNVGLEDENDKIKW